MGVRLATTNEAIKLQHILNAYQRLESHNGTYFQNSSELQNECRPFCFFFLQKPTKATKAYKMSVCVFFCKAPPLFEGAPLADFFGFAEASKASKGASRTRMPCFVCRRHRREEEGAVISTGMKK